MSRYCISIDPSLCSGFGSCVDVAPSLFRLEAAASRPWWSPPPTIGRPGRGGFVPDGRDHGHRGGGG